MRYLIPSPRNKFTKSTNLFDLISVRNSLFFINIFLILICTPAFSAEPSATPTLQQFSKLFTQVAKKATSAVVYIKAEGVGDAEEIGGDMQGEDHDPFDNDFLNRFFGMPYRRGPKQPSISQGSGFLVTPNGQILTNAHVVKGASKITVILHDGREMQATLIGLDSSTDVAVIKIEGKDFPYLKLGNSDDIEVGEWVMAIGSPFQLQASVTVGVVSAKGRQNLRITDFEDFIQTDAAINPGNSGGPLLDLSGNVIGINTAIVSKSGGHVGIGFAIPSNMAKLIMNQIVDNGSVIRGYLGVSLQPLDQDMADAFGLEKPEGALIAEVIKGSPADKAGLKQGDIILECNKVPVKTIGSFRNAISLTKPGTKVSLKVNRSGKIINLSAILTSNGDEMSGSGLIQKLGMEVEPLTPATAKHLGYLANEEGVVVTKVKPGSAAAIAGIRPGFLIMAINHKKVSTLDDFNKALEETKKNRILILAKQGNVTRFYSIKIE